MNIYSDVKNNEERNDSNFQKEGEYVINKMPKYKYDIKIIHDFPYITKKDRPPDEVVHSERFSLLREPNNKLKKITLQKNYNNHNNEAYYQLKKSRSPRIGTARFYPQELNRQNENILNTSFKRIYKNKGKRIYGKNYYYRNNDEKINKNYEDYGNREYMDNMDFNKNNDYNNIDDYCENKRIYKNNNYDRSRNNNYNGDYCTRNFDNYDYYDSYDNNCSYIVDIFPRKPCICQREISRIMNNCYIHGNRINNNNCYCNCDCRYGCRYCPRCGHEIYDRNNITMINDNFGRRNNEIDYYNFTSPSRVINIKYPKTIDRTKRKLQYPKYYNKKPNNINNIHNNRMPDYDFVHHDEFNNQNNNMLYDTYDMNNDSKINKDHYNNIKYIEISNKKNQILTKKIKIPQKYEKSPQKNINNTSFTSADNIRDKNILNKNSPYISGAKRGRINYNSMPKKEEKGGNTKYIYNSAERKSTNIMICKSSEKRQNIKAVPPGQKIYPLIVTESIQKPQKGKIKHKDGTMRNVIKQTSVITSIESSPFQNKTKNLKNQTLIKENITKIYTTLTRDEIEDNNKDNNNNNNNNDDDNNNNNNDDDNNKEKVNNLLNDDFNNDNEDYDTKKNLNFNEDNLKMDNLNINNHTKYKSNDINADINDEDIKEKSNLYTENENNEINNYDLMKNKNSNNINNNSSFNYSALYSNLYETSENINPSKVNEHIKHLKYLYNRYVHLSSNEGAKEESLSNCFLKYSDEEKKEILNNLKKGQLEDKKMYSKLMSIWKENNILEAENNFGDEFVLHE
mgnify:CR=1 FL=1